MSRSTHAMHMREGVKFGDKESDISFLYKVITAYTVCPIRSNAEILSCLFTRKFMSCELQQ